MSRSSTRLKLARLAAEELSKHSVVVGVALFGSVARGEDRKSSDIDLLVLVAQPGIGARLLRTFLPKKFAFERLNLACYTEQMLREGMRTHGSLSLHLKREAVVLADTDGRLAALIESPVDIRRAADVEIANLRQALAPLKDLRQFNGDYLFLLSRIYRISRSLVLARLARSGITEFDTETAFALLTDRAQELEPELRTVARLRPFSDMVHETQPTVLPFSRGERELAASAVRAADRLAVT
jgi:predicted nucleotidyltransferase